MRKKNIQNLSLIGKSEEAIPENLRKEILILYELGLEEYEINYIIYLRTKEKARLKWGG